MEFFSGNKITEFWQCGCILELIVSWKSLSVEVYL